MPHHVSDSVLARRVIHCSNFVNGLQACESNEYLFLDGADHYRNNGMIVNTHWGC